MSKREFKDQQGFLTFAIGEPYLKLAYAQALSIKLTQKVKNCAVVVDKNNADDKYLKIFDEVFIIDYTPTSWDMTQYYRALGFTPWKETILLESDIILTESIDHWWDSLRLRDVCLTKQVRNFRDEIITSRKHRKLFDENLLPNIYAGFVYFRYSQFATEFFFLLRFITQEWDCIAKEHFIKNEDMRFRIDEAFSLAARIVGEQHVTLPINIPVFVHAKESLWELSEQQPWYEQLFCEWNNNVPLVGHYQQRLPFHYHHKEWLTDDIIEQYERNYEKLFTSNTGI